MKKFLKWIGRIVLILILIAPFALVGFLEYIAPFTTAKFDAGQPQNTQIIWDDYDAFWQAVDAAKQSDGTYDKQTFDTVYANNRTDGLKKFDMLRYGGGGVVYDSHAYIPFYQSFRADLTKQAFDKDTIVKVFENARTYYPHAPIPNIRPFMGIANNGGTITQGDIIIAYEMFSKNSTADWQTLNIDPKIKRWMQNVAREAHAKYISQIIAHEYIHYLQASRLNIISRNLMKIHMLLGRDTLLELAYQEGVANFLQSILTGDISPMHSHIQQYVDTHGGTDKFMAEFISKSDAIGHKTIGDWLYSATTSDGRPSDMGYWAGAIIAEMYWHKTPNKQQAFMDLIGDKSTNEIFAIATQ